MCLSWRNNILLLRAQPDRRNSSDLLGHKYVKKVSLFKASSDTEKNIEFEFEFECLIYFCVYQTSCLSNSKQRLNSELKTKI